MRASVFTTYIAALKDATIGFVAEDAMDVSWHKGTLFKENIFFSELFSYFFLSSFACQVKIVNITDNF